MVDAGLGTPTQRIHNKRFHIVQQLNAKVKEFLFSIFHSISSRIIHDYLLKKLRTPQVQINQNLIIIKSNEI